MGSGNTREWFPALSCRYAPIKLLMSLGRLIKGITNLAQGLRTLEEMERWKPFVASVAISQD
jgi:hypothetical protein